MFLANLGDHGKSVLSTKLKPVLNQLTYVLSVIGEVTTGAF